jgi:hypothetical protein
MSDRRIPEEKPDGDCGPDADKRDPNSLPPAGPHADPALTNADATPGAGTLTPSGDYGEVDSTSG